MPAEAEEGLEVPASDLQDSRRGPEPRNAAATARRFPGACRAKEHDLAITLLRSTEPVRASDPQNWTAACGRWVRL